MCFFNLLVIKWPMNKYVARAVNLLILIRIAPRAIFFGSMKSIPRKPKLFNTSWSSDFEHRMLQLHTYS